MNEKELEKLLETPEVQDVELDTKIKKNIDRNIRHKMLKTTIICLVVFLIGGLLTSKGLYAVSYNPLDQNDFILKSDTEDETDEKIKGFKILLETYLNMTTPGYILSFYQPKYEKIGFGGYKIESGLMSLFDGHLGFTTLPMTFTTQWSKMKIDIDKDDYQPFMHHINEYFYAGNGNSNEDQFLINVGESINEADLSYYYDELTLLPDSAILDVAISFKRPYTIEETYDFLAKYPSAQEVWFPIAAIEKGFGSYAHGDFGGFCVAGSGGMDAVDLEKYPDFYARMEKDKTPQSIENMYLSHLKLLIDHHEFTNMMSKAFGGNEPNVETLQERYEMVKENGVQPIGARIYVRKGDLMKMIEQDELLNITVHNVKLSAFSRLNQK